MKEIPRRIQLDKFCPGELAIQNAIAVVEAMPADRRLTEAVILLGKARECVADFLDGVERPDLELESPRSVPKDPEQFNWHGLLLSWDRVDRRFDNRKQAIGRWAYAEVWPRGKIWVAMLNINGRIKSDECQGMTPEQALLAAAYEIRLQAAELDAHIRNEFEVSEGA